MNNKIKQSQINAMAWAACATFRGVVDPTQYKDYLLVMLFLKYISDVWKEHSEKYSCPEKFWPDGSRPHSGSGLQPMGKNFKPEDEPFVLPEAASFYDLYEQREDLNIGEIINKALATIEEANKDRLRGVFRNIDFNSEVNLGKTRDRHRRLKNLLEDFNQPQLDMRPSRVSEDIIGNTYIYLIERFASDAGKKAGEFYTPHQVSVLLAKLAQPKHGDLICDPACGSGGLLIEAARQTGSSHFSLFGMEVNASTWALARMNMLLHGLNRARIDWCNTITAPTLIENNQLIKFNIVVTNPPFSLDKWGADEAKHDPFNRFWRGIPPKNKGDYAFISHIVETAIKRKGRVAVVVPHGVLFRAAAEGRIRQGLIEDNLLDAVVGLPANLFPTTTIPVAILIFDRSREKGGANETRTDVIFIDASREYLPGRNQNILMDEHINKIAAAYQARKDIDKYAYIAPYQEIRANDFNLNISQYVNSFQKEEEIDIEAVQQEIERVELELTRLRVEMKEYLKHEINYLS